MRTRPRKITKKARKVTSIYQLEPTYWETASYAAIAVSGAVVTVTAILISILTFG